MTTRRKSIARKAVTEALRLRRSIGYSLTQSICPFDAAQSLGVEVRFLDLPSAEGVYIHQPKPAIVISSLRPSGRQRFTCAHELKHHVFNEGFHSDELVDRRAERRFDPKEFMADTFAGIFLMPKIAVENAFVIRGWNVETCTPVQAYTIANQFGVGYSTLVTHMLRGLQILSTDCADKLTMANLGQIKKEFLGEETGENLFVVDEHWSGRALDVSVGDLIVMPGGGSLEGACVESILTHQFGTVARAVTPGIGRLMRNSGWSSYVRVSRAGFVGRNLFRHWEEAEDE